ncbi:MAG: NTF2 fold immunity protein [Bacteroidia bacterium]
MKADNNRSEGKIILLVLFSLNRFDNDDKKRNEAGPEKARAELDNALTNLDQHNAVDLKTALIKDADCAHKIAEPILHGAYGEEHIQDQKPFEIHHLDHFWVLKGTRPLNAPGGTFLIILDERDCEVVRLTHGK